MKGPLVRECSEIWERVCFNELVAGPVGVSASVCARAAAAQEADQTRAGARRKTAGNEKGSGHIPETGDTQQPHVGGPLKSRWGRAGDRGAGSAGPCPC